MRSVIILFILKAHIMQLKFIPYFLSLSLFSVAVYAEPPVQAGDTLESLSKVHIQTSVDGQSGSIQDLVDSGQIQIVQGNHQDQSSVAEPLDPLNSQQQSSTPPTDPATPNNTIPVPDVKPSASPENSTLPSPDTPATPNNQPATQTDPLNTPNLEQPDLSSPQP